MRLRIMSGVCVLLSVFAWPGAAAAQDAKTNVAASYTILNDRDINETFPAGWLVRHPEGQSERWTRRRDGRELQNRRLVRR